MNFKSELDHHFYQNRYIYLFFTTILQVFLTSFFPEGNKIVSAITFSLFMLANINFIRHSKRIVYTMVFFGLISIFLVWIPDDSSTGKQFFFYEKLIVIIFICVIIYQIIIQIVRSKHVTASVILGVITIYILFGLIAGEANRLILFYDHAAFTGNLDPFDPSDLRYYSYVTITTLGYGDIAPVSRPARASAVFFSLTGQIYLAVVIAVIVGKYISHSDKRENSKSKD